MDLVRDRRGQSIQIGAVLLFGALIIAFASYQAFVVPDQNRGVEFNHNQQVQSELQDLRNAIVSVGGSDESRSVTVKLGTRYPSRLVARNPSPPSGSLRTVGTDSDSVGLRISNAQAVGETARETGDFWNDSQRYTTGAITYRPNYNVYASAPTTTYEHTVLYNRFESGNITLANQSFIDGSEISLVVLNGTISRSSTEATSVDVRAVSSSTQRVRIEDNGSGPVNITFASTRSAAYWDFLEDTQPNVTSVTNASSGNGFYNVSVELQQDQTYTLKLTKIGVGTGVTGEDTAYLTDVEGDGAGVSQGETTELTLEVRDRFNNPPDDASSTTVEAAVAPGSDGTLRSNSAVPDENGQVTFVYEATGSTGVQQINVSYVGLGSGFDAETVQNVSMTVDVTAPSGGGGGGGGGAYAVNWRDPSSQTGVNCPDGPDSVCTVDAGQTSSVTLSMSTNPIAQDAPVEYALNDTTIGSLSRQTGATNVIGENSTVLTPLSDGGLRVYTTAGSDGDTLVLDVINTVQELVYNSDGTAVDGPDGDTTPGGVEFSFQNSFSQDLEVRSITVNGPGGNTRLSDELGAPNDELRRTEVYIEGDLNDGYVDINGGTSLPNTFDMDTDGFVNNGNPEVSSGGQLSVYLFEFENNGGNRIDMSGNSFDVTITYVLADGTTGSKTVTVTAS